MKKYRALLITLCIIIFFVGSVIMVESIRFVEIVSTELSTYLTKKEAKYEVHLFQNTAIEEPTNNTKIENDVISEPNTTVYAIPLTGNKINDTNTNLSQENTTFNEYLKYLKNSITVNNCNYILVMEKCDEANKGCKYGYLESEECIK